MKFLFLTLLLGLVCAAQEEQAEQSLSEFSGHWRTVYIASSNPEKTREQGPFRVYVHKILFDDEKRTIDIYFCVERNGKWEIIHVTGERQDDGSYLIKYEGTNILRIVYVSNTVLVVDVVNKDEKDVETQIYTIFVKVTIDKEALDIFNKLLREKGIKEYLDFITREDCPPCGLRTSTTPVKSL